VQSEYHCGNPRCKNKGVPVTMPHFREVRMATGRSPRCSKCGDVLWWDRNVEEK
jgi:hypothetical protein